MTRIAVLALLALLVPATAQAEVRRLAGWGDPDPINEGGAIRRTWGPAISPDGFIAYSMESQVDFDEAILYDDNGAIGVPAVVGDTIAAGTIVDMGDLLAVAGTAIVLDAWTSDREVLVAWDASTGLRQVFALDDTLPGGAAGYDVSVVGANTAGQVLLSATGVELALAEHDGSIATVIANGQPVPGAAGYAITAVDAAFLADDGRITVQVRSLVQDVGTETFIVHGRVGALELAASTLDLDGTDRQLQLLGGSPNGHVVYGAISLGNQDIANDRREIRQGAVGDTHTTYVAVGEDAVMDIGARGFAPLNYTSRIVLADNDELAIETSLFDESDGVVQGIALWHDGAWSIVAAADVPLPGGDMPGTTSLSGVNAYGQVLLSTDVGVYRHTPGKGLEAIARAGATFEVGPGHEQPCPNVGATAGDNMLLPTIDSEGNAVFMVGWTDPDGNLQSTAMTTRPLGAIDLALEKLTVDFVDGIGKSLLVHADVRNKGETPVLAQLSIAMPDVAGATAYDCTTPVVGTLVCNVDEAIAPGALQRVTIIVNLEDDQAGEHMGTVTVVPLSGVPDLDPSNDSKTFTSDFGEPEEQEEEEDPKPANCGSSIHASGLERTTQALLALLLLGACRRRRTVSA